MIVDRLRGDHAAKAEGADPGDSVRINAVDGLTLVVVPARDEP